MGIIILCILGSGKMEETKTEEEDATMDTTDERKIHSKTSLKNADGNYPSWMSQRKIQQRKGKKKKPEGKVNKRHKKKYL